MNIQTFSILTEYTHSKYKPPGSQVMLDAGTFQSHVIGSLNGLGGRPRKRKRNRGVFHSVTQSSLTLCDPMDCSTPGFPVHHQLPELAQTHVYQVSDAIQTSHPLLSPSPPAFSLSQHQGLFQ